MAKRRSAAEPARIIPFPKTLDQDMRDTVREVWEALRAGGSIGDSDSVEWSIYQVSRIVRGFEERWRAKRPRWADDPGIEISGHWRSSGS